MPQISLITALALFCITLSPALAAPHALTPADLAAASLAWPAVPTSTMSNETDSSWLSMVRRQFQLNSVALPNSKAGGDNNPKTRSVPVVTLRPASFRSQATSSTMVVPATSFLTPSSTPVAKPSSPSSPKPSSSTPKPSSAAPSATSFPVLASVPSNVAKMMSTNGAKCANTLDTLTKGYGAQGLGGSYPHYCGDKPTKPGVVFWQSNMDVDCDGGQPTGPCANDPSHQSETAFEYQGKPIDAQAIPYVVINDDKYFSPSKMGIQGLATVGVVCGGKLTWAVFADTNPFTSMGEGSVKLAQTCFGSSMNGNNGHGAADVLYFAFTGADAVDPLGGTDYQSLAKRGNALLSRLG